VRLCIEFIKKNEKAKEFFKSALINSEDTEIFLILGNLDENIWFVAPIL